MNSAQFEQIEKNKTLYDYLAVSVYFFINSIINASTVWMEHSRHGESSISLWEPFTWEFSSALATLCIFPAIVWLFKRYPPRLIEIKKQLLIHLIGSILFSLAHVFIMVAIREGVYFINSGNYDFGSISRELWYEYRKDARAYLFFFFIFHMVQYIYSRLKGEASPIAEDEEQADKNEENKIPKHFLVKKLDKEFLVKVSDIEWLESCGNYVNLHSKGRIYPLRSTLANIVTRIESLGFSRIHRSHAINHNEIESISYLPSGDGEISFKSGTKLKLSRSYKEAFKKVFS